MGKAFGIVHQSIATWFIQQGGFTYGSACTGAVTFIQRFGQALNLNVHFHIPFVDGVYLTQAEDVETRLVFRPVNVPSKAYLESLFHRIRASLERFLIKAGILEQDMEHSYLNMDPQEENPLCQVHGHSITYRIAGGFSIHSGVATGIHQGKKLEHICRYVALPAVSEKRLALTRDGRVCYELKAPYGNGSTHVIF